MSSFFKNGFKMVPLATLLDWVSGRSDIDSESNEKVFIALPMIQRGSVWKPLQIINLWDSLLRGMPVGSLMLSQMKNFDSNGGSVKVRKIDSKVLVGIPESGGWGLLDGQQRTLAMLTGWPRLKINKTIWVDFSDGPEAENLFSFHVTTTNQKFGFQKASPNSKLALYKRILAYRYERYEAGVSLEDKDHVAREQPWDCNVPIKISDLIVHEKDLHAFVDKALADRIETFEKVINILSDKDETNLLKVIVDKCDLLKIESTRTTIHKNVESFSYRLNRILSSCQIPLIEVNNEIFEESNNSDDVDPALAILFKRIGSGGTALSDADYVYSVIKHRLPEAYSLIENIAETKSIIQHLTATNIVMTVVRLVAAKIEAADHESPTKKEFHLLLKNPEFEGEFCRYILTRQLTISLMRHN